MDNVTDCLNDLLMRCKRERLGYQATLELVAARILKLVYEFLVPGELDIQDERDAADCAVSSPQALA